MKDCLKKIELCKYCGKPEYYGEYRWLNGRMMCRDCYKEEYERSTGKAYTWDDLDGEHPSMIEYYRQEK